MMTRRRDRVAARVSVGSMGIMLEIEQRIGCAQRGGPHFGSPDKAPVRAAGRSRQAGELADSVHHRHLDRHRRDARRTARRAVRDRATCIARNGHIQEIIVQNFRAKPGHQHGRPRPNRSGRSAVDDRGGAADLRPDDEHPGAAEPVARIFETDHRRHQRLGRHLPGHPGSCEPGGALAATDELAERTARCGKVLRAAADALSGLCASTRPLAGARHAPPVLAAIDAGLGAEDGLGAGPARALQQCRRRARARRPPSPMHEPGHRPATRLDEAEMVALFAVRDARRRARDRRGRRAAPVGQWRHRHATSSTATSTTPMSATYTLRLLRLFQGPRTRTCAARL